MHDLREGSSAISSWSVDRRQKRRKEGAVRSKSAPPTTFLRLVPSLDSSLSSDPMNRQAQLGERLVADMVGGLI